MKLHGVIELHVKGERILREPRFWDKVKKKFGKEPDLRTDRMRAALEATALVDAVRRALKKIDVTNAVSLVVDDQVLFQDREGRPDDLGDLLLAFSENESVFGGGFKVLRLAVEHEEAGLHTIIEVIARGEHPVGEAACRVVVAGRVKDFEPRKGEDAEAYRARVEPLTQKPTLYEAHKRQFDSFASRVADALRATMPEARVEIAQAEAQVQRPSRRAQAGRQPAPPPPTDPRYDPYDVYYPNPFGMMLSMMMWSSIFSMAMPPHVVVVNDHGDHLGTPEEVQAAGGDDLGHDMDSASGDADMGGETSELGDGGDWGDGGGDFDGGGFDGGDFGGDW
jgi:hypothetical protein